MLAKQECKSFFPFARCVKNNNAYSYIEINNDDSNSSITSTSDQLAYKDRKQELNSRFDPQISMRLGFQNPVRKCATLRPIDPTSNAVCYILYHAGNCHWIGMYSLSVVQLMQLANVPMHHKDQSHQCRTQLLLY